MAIKRKNVVALNIANNKLKANEYPEINASGTACELADSIQQIEMVYCLKNHIPRDAVWGCPRTLEIDDCIIELKQPTKCAESKSPNKWDVQIMYNNTELAYGWYEKD